MARRVQHITGDVCGDGMASCLGDGYGGENFQSLANRPARARIRCVARTRELGPSSFLKDGAEIFGPDHRWPD